MSLAYIHESSYIDDNVIIGKDTKIWHFCHVQEGSIIGKDCSLGQNVNIGPGVIIGDNVKIQNNVSIYSGVIIEDDVFIGPSVVFTNVKNPRSFIDQKHKFRKTVLRHGCTIGANATIICGNTVGEYSMVGAGSVVTKNVGNLCVVYGVPAKIHGLVDVNELSKYVNGLGD
jgi:UDP-2-acetamido-3-amino-2,3-dideoxy-glucuronate N-acetyltransferase